MQTPNTDATTRNTYEIGGTTVVMTPAAAAAWNAGDLTEDALAGAEVCDPDGTRTGLWEFIGGCDEWTIRASHMDGFSANRIGDEHYASDFRSRDAAIERLAELGLGSEVADIECLSLAEHYEWICTADADEIISHYEETRREAEGGAA
jgi:hypothetical protein